VVRRGSENLLVRAFWSASPSVSGSEPVYLRCSGSNPAPRDVNTRVRSTCRLGPESRGAGARDLRVLNTRTRARITDTRTGTPEAAPKDSRLRAYPRPFVCVGRPGPEAAAAAVPFRKAGRRGSGKGVFSNNYADNARGLPQGAVLSNATRSPLVETYLPAPFRCDPRTGGGVLSAGHRGSISRICPGRAPRVRHEPSGCGPPERRWRSFNARRSSAGLYRRSSAPPSTPTRPRLPDWCASNPRDRFGVPNILESTPPRDHPDPR